MTHLKMSMDTWRSSSRSRRWEVEKGGMVSSGRTPSGTLSGGNLAPITSLGRGERKMQVKLLQ